MADEEKVKVSHDNGLLEETSSSVSAGSKKQNIYDIESNNSTSEREKGENGNILSQYTEKQAMQMGRNYASKYGLDPNLFAKAAAVARSPSGFNSMEFLSEDDKIALNKEQQSRWHIPRKLVEVIALGSMAAAVQGMDESVINGATIYYPARLEVTKYKNADLIEGLVNGAPYLCASVLACWMSDACNRRLGRKWTIFWTCSISAATCIWQGFINTWWHLFIARFFLGFGIGIKSATVPAYAAECTPKTVRGSLVMLWQFFTAVGIMFGYVACLAFHKIPDRGIAYGLNWRLMLGSACIPAIIVLAQVPFVPESPRWLMGKDRHVDSYNALKSLRTDEIGAARDCFYQYVLLKEEGSYQISFFRKIYEMLTVRRNRNGALGAWVVMFMQQFCGINVIAYYSTSIFIDGGLSVTKALLGSWGFGMINFIFAIPTFFTIDRYGRRILLLITFPLMAAFLLLTMGGFWIDEKNAAKVAATGVGSVSQGRIALIIVGVYLFSCVYSAGEGPVPFTYSAEAFPLYIRDVGMSFATATTWFFNFILAFTWPRLNTAFKTKGAFGWYAAWNVIGFFLVLWFLPETKGLTLEELDEVFSVSARAHAVYQTRILINSFKKHILRQNPIPMETLYGQNRMAVTNDEWNEKTEVSHVE